MVLRRLADHANEQGEAWPSAPTLAGQDMDERTARNALAILEAAGLIRKLGRGSRGYRFALCGAIVTGHPTRSVSGQDARSSGPVTGRHIPHDRAAHPMRPGNTPGKTTKNQSGTTTSNGQHAPTSNGATPRAADGGGGGGDALGGSGGFVGDLAEAAERLAALGVNGAIALAQRAGSDRAVEWVIERAHAAGVRDRAALAAKLIGDGERPPASWKPRHERTRAPAVIGDRRANARQWTAAQAQAEAERALIARHADIADRAVELFITQGGELAELVARKPASERRTHRLAREAVLAAIERETGERPKPPSNHTERPSRAGKAATCA